jgi:hypothetical protein
VDELDEPEVYVAKDLCIFMKEVGWKPDRTVFNGNSIYNGTRMSEGVLLYIINSSSSNRNYVPF